MKLLRIYGSLLEHPQHCQWALIDGSREPVTGEGALTALPRQAGRIQLVIPASQVLIMRASVPQAARRAGGSVLAYAVEEHLAGDPEAVHVTWLGSVGDEDVLAVIDKPALERWNKALEAVGIHIDAVKCETLMLPIRKGAWSLAWNGSDGFVRCGLLEGAATDCGDKLSPPKLLRLMLEEAGKHRPLPISIDIYLTQADAAPDVAAWQTELGIPINIAGAWDWRKASVDSGGSLVTQDNRWRIFSGIGRRLRPAAWILATAMAIHGVALGCTLMLLANDQQALRRGMTSQFRAVFPDAVAIVDPVLQMRRKLAEVRHLYGTTDAGDFMPMIERIAAAAKPFPGGTLRKIAYDGVQMTLEIGSDETEEVRRMAAQLTSAGLIVRTSTVASGTSNAKVVMKVSAI